MPDAVYIGKPLNGLLFRMACFSQHAPHSAIHHIVRKKQFVGNQSSNWCDRHNLRCSTLSVQFWIASLSNLNSVACVVIFPGTLSCAGHTELGQYFASSFCEDQTEKVCDRGSWPPAPPFQCCVGKRAGSFPVGQKSCEVGPRSRFAFNIEIGGRGGSPAQFVDEQYTTPSEL